MILYHQLVDTDIVVGLLAMVGIFGVILFCKILVLQSRVLDETKSRHWAIFTAENFAYKS